MIGREIRNPREYSDSLQIECWEFQNVTKTFKFKISERILKTHKKRQISKRESI